MSSPAPRRIARSGDWPAGFGAHLGDDPELIHEPQRVPVGPLLDDATVLDPVDVDAGELDLLARGRHAEQFAVMASAGRPATDHLVALGYLIVDADVQAGEGASISLDRGAVGLATPGRLRLGGVVANDPLADQLVKGGEIPALDHLLDHSPEDLLVVGAHRQPPFGSWAEASPVDLPGP